MNLPWFAVIIGCWLAALPSLAGAPAPTTAAARRASWKRHVRLKEVSPFKDLAWKSVGPRMQGGRIECIACPPGHTSTIYVGAGSGNLFKTVNNGITWKPIFDDEATFAMGDVAVSPSRPDTVWLGTGEVLMARSSYAGAGVFKSTDGGSTWRAMGLEDTHHIGRVLIDPQDPDTVFVAAIGHLYTFNEQRGVFKTADGGATWRKVLYVNEQTGVTDIVADPSDRHTLLAAAWQHDRKAWNHDDYGPGSGLYKSTDGGETWRRLRGGLPEGDGVGRFGIDIAPSSPRIVYALCDLEGAAAGLYRSGDKGESWTKVEGQPVRAGYDFCTVKVSPDDAEEIYIPGVRTLHSTDGGKTFQQVKGTLVHLLPHGSRILHLDAHALWIDPLDPDHLLLGNDGGLHVSYDRGGAWLHINNLPIAEFYAVSFDMATPFNIYGGTQDNAALFGPADRAARDGEPDPWRHVYLDPWGGGDSYFTYLDPTDGTTIYYEHQFGGLKRKNMKTGRTESIRPRPAKGEPPLRCNWMTPFVISHHDPRTLYYAANRIFKSRDRGDSWTAISPDLSTRPGPERQGNVPFGTITSISESPLRPGLLYAGTDDGNIQVTSDDGGTWTLVRGGCPDRWISRVTASVHDEDTVYAALTGYREDDFTAYLYRSTDRGRNWTSIASNLPGESVNVIREDPAAARILYVGTDLGVYVSTNGGAGWHSLCNNLPTTPVHDLFIHPRDGVLVIATHGRSVFTLDAARIRFFGRERWAGKKGARKKGARHTIIGHL